MQETTRRDSSLSATAPAWLNDRHRPKRSFAPRLTVPMKSERNDPPFPRALGICCHRTEKTMNARRELKNWAAFAAHVFETSAAP